LPFNQAHGKRQLKQKASPDPDGCADGLRYFRAEPVPSEGGDGNPENKNRHFFI